jgi:hypothetical protein
MPRFARRFSLGFLRGLVRAQRHYELRGYRDGALALSLRARELDSADALRAGFRVFLAVRCAEFRALPVVLGAVCRARLAAMVLRPDTRFALGQLGGHG